VYARANERTKGRLRAIISSRAAASPLSMRRASCASSVGDKV
jgi:hypothetical protein